MIFHFAGDLAAGRLDRRPSGERSEQSLSGEHADAKRACRRAPAVIEGSPSPRQRWRGLLLSLVGSSRLAAEPATTVLRSTGPRRRRRSPARRVLEPDHAGSTDGDLGLTGTHRADRHAPEPRAGDCLGRGWRAGAAQRCRRAALGLRRADEGPSSLAVGDGRRCRGGLTAVRGSSTLSAGPEGCRQAAHRPAPALCRPWAIGRSTSRWHGRMKLWYARRRRAAGHRSRGLHDAVTCSAAGCGP